MSIGKANPEPLIPPKWEDYFREEFTWHWNEGHSAKEIFEEMQFDDPENTPWKPLKMYHIYYFARKYKLKKRHVRRKERTE